MITVYRRPLRKFPTTLSLPPLAALLQQVLLSGAEAAAAQVSTSGEYFVATKPGGSCSRCSRWSVLPAALRRLAVDATDAATVTRMTTTRHAATARRLRNEGR